MKERQLYKQALYETFASENYNQGQCDVFIRDFEKLVNAGMSPEAACGICYSAWGSSSPERVCRTIKDWIANELSGYNASHPGVNKDPIHRLREWVARYNAAVGKCSIELDGKPALTDSELAKVKIKLPGCLNPPTTYQATASSSKGEKVFELDVSE
jgi:hypothetical protein